jgi:hypothetical protein
MPLFVTVETTCEYPAGSKIYSPTIQSDQDIEIHYDYIYDFFTRMDHFPKQIRSFFHLPIDQCRLPSNTHTLVFGPFRYEH